MHFLIHQDQVFIEYLLCSSTGHKPVNTCIVRPAMSKAALTSLGLTELQKPDYEFPCSSSPISCTPRGFQPNGLQFPARLPNYSKKPITFSCGKRGAPHFLVSTKPDASSSCWFALFPSANLCGLACAQYPLPPAVSVCG